MKIILARIRVLVINNKFLPIIILTILIANKKSIAITEIRDLELNYVVQKISSPILKAAGLEPKKITLHIINSSELNAYTNGQNIYIYAGLLLNFKHPEMLAAVIAHEVGHITGKHVMLMSSKFEEFGSKSFFAGILLGGAITLLSGSPDLGMASAIGSLHVAERDILSFSRENEQKADRAAIDYLIKSGVSPNFLSIVFKFFAAQDNLENSKNKYLSTHPLNSERLNNIRNYTQKLEPKILNATFDINLQKDYQRLQQKLIAFFTNHNSIKQNLQKQPVTINEKYAQVIYLYKLVKIKEALYLIDYLIKQEPNNPFFYDTKAQILFEQGQLTEAIKYYNITDQLLPDQPLTKHSLALTQIAAYDQRQNKEYLIQAIDNLNFALKLEPYNPDIYKRLSIAYGKQGNIGKAYLYMAEEQFIYGEYNKVKKFAKSALKYLKNNSTDYHKVQDLLELTSSTP